MMISSRNVFRIATRRRQGLIALALLLFSVSRAALAQETQTGFVEKVLTDDAGEHKYVLFVPKDYTPEKKWPVILFLHGAGERGTDNQAQLTVGLGPAVRKRADSFPFLVVFPQCEDTKGPILQCWHAEQPNGKRAIEILKQVEKEYSVDTGREILTGWSMGGYGAWALGAAHPTRWSAVVAISGGGNPATAKELKNVPVLAIHGSEDRIVSPAESKKMVDALVDAGGNVTFQVSGAGHDVWQAAYDDPALYRWMLDPKSAPPSVAELRVRPGAASVTPPASGQPFVPALEIPRAVYVRLGNEMFEALSVSVPKSVPREALSGRIADIYDSTTVEGRGFQIAFTGIGYSANVTQAAIKAYRKDRLNIQLALENASLTIGTTYVSGQDHSAVAGPISVVIGHRGPVWLSFDVTPYIENRQLKLKLVATRFDIPHDNWYVSSPAGVSTRGLGMNRDRVSSGLVSGLYGSKARIEREVQAVVPALVKQVEARLDLSQATEMVESFWPLPVYRPRVRTWPEAVSTDENGVSILMGVDAAAVDARQAPAVPIRALDVGRPLAAIPQEKQLQIGVAPDMLAPLTDMLIQADVARIHVADIPEKRFGPLADAVSLAEAIPDLKRLGPEVEIWSELILARPLTVQNVERDGGRQLLQFEIPKLLLSLAVRKDRSEEWTPYAEFEITVAQDSVGQVVEPDDETRALKLEWFGDPQIEVTGRFAPGYTPENEELNAGRIQEMFAEGWTAWTQRGPVSQTTVPDVNFGLSLLRLSKFEWSPPYLDVRFGVPQIQITNSSDMPLVYEVKGPASPWGGPYTLAPGQSHEFDVPYALTYRRRQGDAVNVFTLAAGSRSEFRVPLGGGAPQLFAARPKQPLEEPNQRASK